VSSAKLFALITLFYLKGETQMEVTQEKGNLVIKIPMNSPPSLSASQKSFVVASTRGNVETNLVIDGKPVKLGVNAYYSAK
jgi:hypothetical protein